MPWKHTLWAILAAMLLTIAPASAQVTLPTPAPPDAFDADAIAEIDLTGPPVIPKWTDTAREIYTYGQTLDRDPRCRRQSRRFRHRRAGVPHPRSRPTKSTPANMKPSSQKC